MRSMTERFLQSDYLQLGQLQAEFHSEFLKALPADERGLYKSVRNHPRTDAEAMQIDATNAQRYLRAKKMMGNIIKYRMENEGNRDALRKFGISTQNGFNFYDLRAPVLLQYPVNTPLRNAMASEGPVNAGVGTSAHWKGTTDIGVQPISVPEGFRAPVRTPNEVDFTSVYKEFGVEGALTFTSQWAGEGLVDNLADQHLQNTQALFLGEEGMILHGNCGTSAFQGTAGNGFVLGTPAAPTLTLNAGASNGTLGSVTVYVAVVMMTSMGYPITTQYGYGAQQSVAGGLIPYQTLRSPVGETFQMPGGTSAISALSSGQAVSGTQTVTATVANKPGAFGFGWFVSTNASPTLANSYLYAITTVPTVTITSAASSSAQNGTAVGLNADNSYTSLDFAGLLPQAAWGAANYTWPKGGGQWNDNGGQPFTSAGHGMVTQIENALENCFANWQCGYTDIFCSHDVARSLTQAILASGTAYTGMQIVVQPGSAMAPTPIVTGYPSRYAVDSPGGNGVIPIRVHPMMPPGTMYLAINKNPYPQSRIGNVLAALIQRDYYSIEWPVTSRDWTFATYRQYVLAHRLPWIPQVWTNIGTYTGQ